MKKLGKHGRQWNNARRLKKKFFVNQSISRCELCSSDFGLSMAHRKKRRFINSKDELLTVALLCIPCHERIEKLPHAEMEKEINQIIENRGNRYWEAA